MFGYSVVPTRVLDALLARVRELEAREDARTLALTSANAPPAPSPVRRRAYLESGAVYPLPFKAAAPAPVKPAAPSASTLPEELRGVCERFAWSPEELAANVAHAERLHASGASPGVIARAIAKGADVDALFVG